MTGLTFPDDPDHLRTHPDLAAFAAPIPLPVVLDALRAGQAHRASYRGINLHIGDGRTLDDVIDDVVGEVLDEVRDVLLARGRTPAA